MKTWEMVLAAVAAAPVLFFAVKWVTVTALEFAALLSGCLRGALEKDSGHDHHD